MRSREDITYEQLTANEYVNTDTILFQIAESLGRIADILAEMAGYTVECDPERKEHE